MFPQSLLANSSLIDFQYWATGMPTGDWKAWQKPMGKAFAYILCIGPGGGAGGGATANTGGGGGGGTGGVSALYYPLFLMPDTLFIQVGLGGIGGAAGIDGSVGGNTFVTNTAKQTTSNFTWLEAFGGNGGSHGAATGGAAAGGGGVPTVGSNAKYAQLGNSSFLGPSAAVAGGSNAAGPNITPFNLKFLCGGAGGGGGANAGGGVVGNFPLAAIPGGAGSTTGGSDGSAGVTLFGPNTGFLACGGAGGGGATTSGNGGAGGKGGSGCGGGGGGSSTNGTGGSGGNGGDGFIGIWCA